MSKMLLKHMSYNFKCKTTILLLLRTLRKKMKLRIKIMMKLKLESIIIISRVVNMFYNL